MFEQIKLHRFLSTNIMTSIIRLSLVVMSMASFVGVGIVRAQSSLVSNGRPSTLAKTKSARNAAKPTIVLVHGAFADATSWQHVIPILERDGYNVIAVQNALASLAGDVETTKRVIDAQSGPVVVVGHSYGGAVITGAAAENANVNEKQPRLLVIWGKYDLSFDLGEPERYRQDVPKAEVHVLNAGHFALDTAADEIAALVRGFVPAMR
jgi:pimeloyl-ACP methyl ester carboxylesterase